MAPVKNQTFVQRQLSAPSLWKILAVTSLEGRPTAGRIIICLLPSRQTAMRLWLLAAERDSTGENKSDRSRERATRDCTPSLHKRAGIGSYTDVSASDGCRTWADFVPGPSVCAHVPHIKPNFLSHLVLEAWINISSYLEVPGSVLLTIRILRPIGSVQSSDSGRRLGFIYINDLPKYIF